MKESFPHAPVEQPPSPEDIAKAEGRARESWGRLKPLLSRSELMVNEGTVRALGRVDAVLRRLPKPVQEFLHGAPLEQIMGMPPPPPSPGGESVSSVVEALYGISAVRKKQGK